MAKKLTVGDIAPEFTLKDVHGKRVKLSESAGNYTLLAFLRYADCPWCNLAIHRLTLESPILKDSRCTIITFIQSSDDQIKESIHQKHAVTPPFPVIADPDMHVYEKYGVKPSLVAGLKHHIVNAPKWVFSVQKFGLRNQQIDQNFFLAPAVFLLAPQTREIIYASYVADLYEDATFTKFYDVIADHSVHGRSVR